MTPPSQQEGLPCEHGQGQAQAQAGLGWALLQAQPALNVYLSCSQVF